MVSKSVLKILGKWGEITGARINDSQDFYFTSVTGCGLYDKVMEEMQRFIPHKITVKRSVQRTYKYTHDKKKLSTIGKINENRFAVKFDGLPFNELYIEDMLSYIGPVTKIEHWVLEKDVPAPDGAISHIVLDLLVFVDAENEMSYETGFGEVPPENDKEFDIEGMDFDMKIDPPLIVEDIEEASTATFDPLAW